MAKKDKKPAKIELSKKERKALALKALADAEEKLADKKSKKKGKGKKPEPEPKGKGKKTKVAKAVEEVVKPTAKEVKGTDWDMTDGSGADYFKLPSGKYLGRIRSVISCGQVQFEFNGVLNEQATSALGLVIEVWKYKIKKDKVKILNSEPAVVYDVVKAIEGNNKSNYGKTTKALDIKNPGQFLNRAVGIELYTSDKGYMYVRGALTALGLAESKATPKLTKKGMAIPNLDCMTKDALLELNPITQVKEYVLKAVNLEGTAAEKQINKIRKEKPNFAMLKKKDDEGKGSKKGKKSKKKLDDNKTY